MNEKEDVDVGGGISGNVGGMGVPVPNHVVDWEDVAASGNRSEVRNETVDQRGDSSGIGSSAMGTRAMVRDSGTVGDTSGKSSRLAPKDSMTQTVLPGMSLVASPQRPLVTRNLTEKGVATSGTKRVSINKSKSLEGKKTKPPSVPGHEWRPAAGGWVLWERTTFKGDDEKWKSKRRYVKFYPSSAVEVINGGDVKHRGNGKKQRSSQAGAGAFDRGDG